MSEDGASLARQFAHALEQMRATWDLQYVGAGPVPTREQDGAEAEAEVEATAVSEPAAASEPEPAPAAAPVTTSSPTEASAPAPSRTPEPPRPAATQRPTAAPSQPSAPPRSAAAPSRSSAPPAAKQSPAADPPSPSAKPPASASSPASDADPAQEARADAARKEALREQAQRWSPATKLEYLRQHNVGDCRRCPLARTRTNIVFGVGNPEADVMFVGEAPGADEDRQGEPFVGRSGRLLDQWLVNLGMQRGDVYIANVLKCRPPGNRDPKPGEVDRCSPFLQAQIRAIEPKVIVALGRHAGMLLSRREDMTLRAMRSTSRLQYDAGAPKSDPKARIRIPLVVTYHPAYVLRQEGDGRRPPAGRPSPTEMVMKDLRRALSIANVAATDGPRR